MQNITQTPHASDTAMEPHQITQAQFVVQSLATRLEKHGRKWNVCYLGYSAFSDAESADAAKIDVHHGAVNNALYLNSSDAPEIDVKPTVPTVEVLTDYPDLVVLYAAVLEAQPIASLHVTKAEYDAVIAALRLLAASLTGGLVSANDGDIGDILTDEGTHSGLTAVGVHDLCDRFQQAG